MNKPIIAEIQRDCMGFKKGQVLELPIDTFEKLFSQDLVLIASEKALQEYKDRQEILKPKNVEMAGDSPNLKITNYVENTRKFWNYQPFFYDESKLFWKWDINNPKWVRVDETEMLTLINRKLKLSGEIVTSQTKNNYLEAFRQVGRQYKPKEAKKTWIQFKSKVYDLETGFTHDATPEYFFTNPLPWDIGENEETPVMDKLFEEWVGPKYMVTLYEIIAYCCLSDYPIHRLFILVGSGSNGKTTFFELLSKFIGQDNITSTELDTLLNSRFEVTRLFRKLVCVMGETDFMIMHKTSMIKKLTGQDLIGFEFKNKNPFESKNYAKLLIASNSLPITQDKSRGFYRRIFIILFSNEFSGKKDILKTIPEHEYNNLAKKSIAILKNLLETRQFQNEGTIDEREKQYEAVSNILLCFLHDRCTKDVEESLPFTEFYSEFTKYCREQKKRPLSATMVGRLLSEEGHERTNKTLTITDDDHSKKSTSQRIILGLKWKNEIQQLL